MVDLVDAQSIERAAGIGRVAVHPESELPARRGVIDVAIPCGVEFGGQKVASVLVGRVEENRHGLGNGEAGEVLCRAEDGEELLIRHMVAVVLPESGATDETTKVDLAAAGGTGRCRRSGGGGGWGTAVRAAVAGVGDRNEQLVDVDHAVAVDVTTAGDIRGTTFEGVADDHDQLVDRHHTVAVEIAGAQLRGRGRHKPQPQYPSETQKDSRDAAHAANLHVPGRSAMHALRTDDN